MFWFSCSTHFGPANKNETAMSNENWENLATAAPAHKPTYQQLRRSLCLRMAASCTAKFTPSVEQDASAEAAFC